jgi:hypothetical protein
MPVVCPRRKILTSTAPISVLPSPMAPVSPKPRPFRPSFPPATTPSTAIEGTIRRRSRRTPGKLRHHIPGRKNSRKTQAPHPRGHHIPGKLRHHIPAPHPAGENSPPENSGTTSGQENSPPENSGTTSGENSPPENSGTTSGHHIREAPHPGKLGHHIRGAPHPGHHIRGPTLSFPKYTLLFLPLHEQPHPFAPRHRERQSRDALT